MPTGQEMWMTGSQPPATCSGLRVDLYRGEAENRTPWLCQPLKRSMLHCQVQRSSVSGCADWSLNWEIHQEDPPSSWKTTSRPLLWPRIRSFMGEPNKASFCQGASECLVNRAEVLSDTRDVGRRPDQRTTPAAVLSSSREGRNFATN